MTIHFEPTGLEIKKTRTIVWAIPLLFSTLISQAQTQPTGYTDLGYFAITKTSVAAALPVKLIQFDAKKSGPGCKTFLANFSRRKQRLFFD